MVGNSRRVTRRNAGVSVVLRSLRRGERLHLEYHQTGPRWRMSGGPYVNDSVARAVIADRRVIGVNDVLFPGLLSQTWEIADLREPQKDPAAAARDPSTQRRT